MKRRHHYVPRFYLEAFACAPKRINVCNLKGERAVQNASLRDQCHSHRLYGRSDDLEDALAGFESMASPVLREIRVSLEPPGLGTDAYARLLPFIALQLLRTIAAQTRVHRSSVAFADKAFDGAPPADFVIDQDEAMALALGSLRHMRDGLDGVRMHLVTAPHGTEFITSDNPAFVYNQYCEGVTWRGVTGVACTGIQLFLPISPQCLLLLFDGRVYKVGRRGVACASEATVGDVEQLNGIQLLAAHENVYFASAATVPAVARLAESFRDERRKNRLRVIEAFEVGNERSSVIHQFERMPNLRLTLSFVSLRRDARRVPLESRVALMRKALQDDGQPPTDSQVRVFETRTRV